MTDDKTSLLCVIAGQGGLSIRCAERIISNNHRISSIVTNDISILAWSEERGIETCESLDLLKDNVIKKEIDCLFSINNNLIINCEITQSLKIGAFNYHDSHLPRFAGRHATSWALLEQSKKHAATWHWVSDKVNAGDIAVQRSISISSDETALSLDLKCHDAALAAFDDLMRMLSGKNIDRISQDLTQRTFYSSRKRPDAWCCLQWNKTSKEIGALVRSLTFGNDYANPLGCPKLLLNNEPKIVTGLGNFDFDQP